MPTEEKDNSDVQGQAQAPQAPRASGDAEAEQAAADAQLQGPQHSRAQHGRAGDDGHGPAETAEHQAAANLGEAELFAQQDSEELLESELFVSDDDLYESIKQATPSDKTGPPPPPSKINADQQPRRSWYSAAQKMLAVAILAIVALLLRTSFKLLSSRASDERASVDQAPAATVRQQSPPGESEAAPEPEQPASLLVAHDFYRNAQYDRAYAAYDRLARALGPDAQGLRDFFDLRMALCRIKSGKHEQADRLLDNAARSHSPIVSIMANYHRSLLELQRKQYLNARASAYKALALVSTVESYTDLARLLRQRCTFLVAQATTQKVLSLSDANDDLPPELWKDPGEIDPFIRLSDRGLKALLACGSDHLKKALLAPQIYSLGDAPVPRWHAACYAAPVEEVFARFAANSGLDVTWSPAPSTDQARKNARQRPVTLYMPAATTKQLIRAAAGQVGLLAKLEDSKAITIYQGDKYASLSDHLALLTRRAIDIWQGFLVNFHDDRRLANVHLALAMLYSLKQSAPEAIAEYKLVANGFSSSPLAPYALLGSSRLKNSLRDYAGACQDLRELVEQYSGTEIANRAYVYLADSTAKAGQKAEAARLYRMVYNVTSSAESQKAAAFGAGTCYYDAANYELAAKWLSRFIDLAEEAGDRHLGSAYFLLGKTFMALQQPDQACRALRHAMAAQLSRQEYVDAVSTLIEAYVAHDELVEAIDVLEDIDAWQLSEAQSVELLLTKCRLMRRIGLPDKAIAELGDKDLYATDEKLKARIAFERAKCHITADRLDVAYKQLAEILAAAEPGELADQLKLALAQVSLKLGRYAQAVSLATALLDSPLPQQTRHEAERILAAAHVNLEDYDRAALALLGRTK